MKKIGQVLSIDWDYFINATTNERAWLFPDGGNENLTPYVENIIWASRYCQTVTKKFKYKSIEEIGIKEHEVEILKEILKQNSEANSLACLSHKHIYAYLNAYKMKYDAFNIINIDYHHDMYHIGEDVNCGNWVNKLHADGLIEDFTWINQKDSCGIKKPFRLKTTFDIKKACNKEYDLIFICRSDMWSPPHLDVEFHKVLKHMNAIVLSEVNNESRSIYDNRFELIKKHIEEYKIILENMRGKIK